MKRSTLERKLSDFNQKQFGDLLERVGIRPSAPLKGNSQVDIGWPLAPTDRNCDCFCGRTGHGFECGCQIAERGIVLKKGGAGRLAAVGAVLDGEDKGDADKPVVAAVGINYGQGNDYLIPRPAGSGLVGISDDTGMRHGLDAVGKKLRERCDGALPEDEFHLVAANFFPWITTEGWSELKFNSIEKSFLLHCYGWSDPIAYIEDLVSCIGQVDAIVFHGANNVVPYYGMPLARKYRGVQYGTKVIFCDNLGQVRRVANAVLMDGPTVSSTALVSSNFDE